MRTVDIDVPLTRGALEVKVLRMQVIRGHEQRLRATGFVVLAALVLLKSLALPIHLAYHHHLIGGPDGGVARGLLCQALHDHPADLGGAGPEGSEHASHQGPNCGEPGQVEDSTGHPDGDHVPHPIEEHDGDQADPAIKPQPSTGGPLLCISDRVVFDPPSFVARLSTASIDAVRAPPSLRRPEARGPPTLV